MAFGAACQAAFPKILNLSTKPLAKGLKSGELLPHHTFCWVCCAMLQYKAIMQHCFAFKLLWLLELHKKCFVVVLWPLLLTAVSLHDKAVLFCHWTTDACCVNLLLPPAIPV
eukprot:GHRR01029148.1.p2 GENE.GHRR01029148.1~~GHRR01029148.1.p2  ORF type:complete len:112 (+),score=17.24 GHRR01029148.1:281-616(+)